MSIMSWLQDHFVPKRPDDIPSLPDLAPLRKAVTEHRAVSARGTVTAAGASVTGPCETQDAPLYRDLGPHGQVMDDLLHQMVHRS